jgi:hypothetical protein
MAGLLLCIYRRRASACDTPHPACLIRAPRGIPIGGLVEKSHTVDLFKNAPAATGRFCLGNTLPPPQKAFFESCRPEHTCWLAADPVGYTYIYTQLELAF